MDEPIQIVIDPFTVLGFFNPMQYIKMKKLPVKQFELLPVTPVFVHPKNTAELPGYYSDIIMHTDVKYVPRNIAKYVPAYVFYWFTVIDFLLVFMSVCVFLSLTQENGQVVSGPERMQLGIHRRQFAQQQLDHPEVAPIVRRKLVVLRQHNK